MMCSRRIGVATICFASAFFYHADLSAGLTFRGATPANSAAVQPPKRIRASSLASTASSAIGGAQTNGSSRGVSSQPSVSQSGANGTLPSTASLLSMPGSQTNSSGTAAASGSVAQPSKRDLLTSNVSGVLGQVRPVSVPEPSSILLMAFVGAALTLRHLLLAENSRTRLFVVQTVRSRVGRRK